MLRLSVIALSIFPALVHAQATDSLNSCSFYGTWENCRLTGEGKSIDVTYAKTVKKLSLRWLATIGNAAKKMNLAMHVVAAKY